MIDPTEPNDEAHAAAEAAAYAEQLAYLGATEEDIPDEGAEDDELAVEHVDDEDEAEGAEEPEVEDGRPKPKPKPVPYSKFAETRRELKATREREQETLRRFSEIQGALNAWQTMQQAQQQPAPAKADTELPPIDEWLAKGGEPAEYLERIRQEQKATREEIAKRQQAEAQQREQGELMARVNSAYVNDINRVVAQVPDYGDALAHLANLRGAQLRALGWQDEQIRDALNREEQQIVTTALQNKRSPAETLYALAQASGYVPGQQAQQRQAPAKSNSPADRIARGQQAAGRSLSSVGGGAAKAGVAVDDLLKMSREDFAAFTKKFPKQAEKLMTGG